MAVTAPFSVECWVGRLVEAKLLVPRTTTEVDQFADALLRTFSTVGSRCVICADWRAASLLAPDVADAVVALLRRGNPHLERSGVLLSGDKALFNLQVERVVREAANPARRAFREAAPMRRWLSEVLDDEERRRLAEFLVDRAA